MEKELTNRIQKGNYNYGPNFGFDKESRALIFSSMSKNKCAIGTMIAVAAATYAVGSYACYAISHAPG